MLLLATDDVGRQVQVDKSTFLCTLEGTIDAMIEQR